jgi:DNA-binding LacI/PurR family transcriptional regulator
MVLMTSPDISRLAAEAICSERTVRRWIENQNSVNEHSRLRIEAALKRLKLKAPSYAKESKH